MVQRLAHVMPVGNIDAMPKPSKADAYQMTLAWLSNVMTRAASATLVNPRSIINITVGEQQRAI